MRRINIEILGVYGLMGILEPLKNQSESWKSPGNLFLKRVRTLKHACTKKFPVMHTTTAEKKIHARSAIEAKKVCYTEKKSYAFECIHTSVK